MEIVRHTAFAQGVLTRQHIYQQGLTCPVGAYQGDLLIGTECYICRSIQPH